MEITIAKEYEFTPEWGANKQDPNPVVFHLRYLGTAEREKLLRYEFGTDGGVKILPDKQGLFLASVLSVDNLVVNKEPIRTAREILARPGLDFLFLEVVASIIGQNAREEPKN